MIGAKRCIWLTALVADINSVQARTARIYQWITAVGGGRVIITGQEEILVAGAEPAGDSLDYGLRL